MWTEIIIKKKKSIIIFLKYSYSFLILPAAAADEADNV